jgi:hypothetical protein
MSVSKPAILILLFVFLAVVITSYLISGSPTKFFERIFLSISTPGRLQIAGVPPEVMEVRIEDITCSDTDPLVCNWNGGQEGVRTTIPISVLIRDNNGDCGTNANLQVMVYLCDVNNLPCTELGSTRSSQLAGTKTQDPGGMGVEYCLIESDLVADPLTQVYIEFQEPPVNWGLYSKVSDDSGTTWGTVDLDVLWNLQPIIGARYPTWDPDPDSRVDFGSLNPGVWNDGVEDQNPAATVDRVKNSGNVPLTIEFRATDFAHVPDDGDYIEVESSFTPIPCTYDEPPADGVCDFTLYVDDDGQRGEAVEVGDPHTGIRDEDNEGSPAYVQFPPAPTNLDVCASYTCDDPAQDVDTYENIYYHLYIKPGAVGEYINTIGVQYTQV